jgi:hypothetical protein
MALAKKIPGSLPVSIFNRRPICPMALAKKIPMSLPVSIFNRRTVFPMKLAIYYPISSLLILIIKIIKKNLKSTF